jgi:hypothetical protein
VKLIDLDLFLSLSQSPHDGQPAERDGRKEEHSMHKIAIELNFFTIEESPMKNGYFLN